MLLFSEEKEAKRLLFLEQLRAAWWRIVELPDSKSLFASFSSEKTASFWV
jgi:hypothetical protein